MDYCGDESYRHFAQCQQYPITAAEWNELCHRTLVLCLAVWSLYGEKVKKANQWSTYDLVEKGFRDLGKFGTGALTTNHSLKQKAMLGLLPSWIREYSLIDPNCRSYDTFHRKFGIKQNQSATKDLTKRLIRKLNDEFKESFNVAMVEHLNCLTSRQLSNHPSNWCDCKRLNRPLYRCDPNQITILFPLGNEMEIEGRYVISKFPFGNVRLDMKIISEMSEVHTILHNGLPTLVQLIEFKCPRDLTHPRKNIETEFEITTEHNITTPAGQKKGKRVVTSILERLDRNK